MKAGKKRVKLDPDSLDLIDDAITKASIRGLIQQGVIRRKPTRGVSRGRFRARRKRISKRGRGQGSREGASGARSGKKTLWVTKVRKLRGYLKFLRDKGHITGDVFRDLYKQVKGGQVRSVRHLKDIVGKTGRE